MLPERLRVCICASSAEPLLPHSLASTCCRCLVWPACWVGQLLAFTLFSVLTYYTVVFAASLHFSSQVGLGSSEGIAEEEGEESGS